MSLSILKQPIQNLPISPSFKLMAEVNQIRNMEELLKNPVYEMLKLNGFNYHRLDELVKFLVRYDFSDKLIQL